jgi:hypothetical protein
MLSHFNLKIIPNTYKHCCIWFHMVLVSISFLKNLDK